MLNHTASDNLIIVKEILGVSLASEVTKRWFQFYKKKLQDDFTSQHKFFIIKKKVANISDESMQRVIIMIYNFPPIYIINKVLF